jgi:hypothetical protein
VGGAGERVPGAARLPPDEDLVELRLRLYAFLRHAELEHGVLLSLSFFCSCFWRRVPVCVTVGRGRGRQVRWEGDVVVCEEGLQGSERGVEGLCLVEEARFVGAELDDLGLERFEVGFFALAVGSGGTLV